MPLGTNWLVGTLAGSGIRGTNSGLASDTQFSYPSGIAVTVTTNGTLYYVADSLNDTIRSGGNSVITTNIFLGAFLENHRLQTGVSFYIHSRTVAR